MSTPTPPDPDPDPRRPARDGRADERQRSGAAGPAGSAGSGGPDGGDEDASQTEVTPPVPFTQQLGRITIVVLAVLFGVFALANSQRVDFSWIFGETTVQEGPTGEVTGGVPLILLLVGAFAAGAVIAILTELYVARARRARKAAAERRPDEGKGGKRKGGKGKDGKRKDEGGA